MSQVIQQNVNLPAISSPGEALGHCFTINNAAVRSGSVHILMYQMMTTVLLSLNIQLQPHNIQMGC